MIDHCNSTRQDHIMTIEDPIEFVHRNKSCLVNQREVGSDTMGFQQALRRVLRQDQTLCSLVKCGTRNDRSRVNACRNWALNLCYPAYVKLCSDHQPDCRRVSGIPTKSNSYSAEFCVRRRFCQQLIPIASSRGRALCAEIMMPTSAIRSLIREDKCHQIQSHIQTGSKHGMRTMNQSLFMLYQKV